MNELNLMSICVDGCMDSIHIHNNNKVWTIHTQTQSLITCCCCCLDFKKKNCVYICLMIGNNIYWRQCPWLFHLPAFSFFYIYPFNSKSSIQSNKSQSNFFIIINMIHLYYTRLLYIHEIHSLVCVSVFFFFCNNILLSS